MGLLEIADLIKERYPDQIVEIVTCRGQAAVILQKDKILEICRWLHDDPALQFNHLADLCGVDYLGKKDVRFEVVYNLYSIPNKKRIRLRAEVPEDDCQIDSVTPIWIGANWHERECFDLLGIRFKGHPDMRRILLPEDWEGHPLRKDYPLDGGGKNWRGYDEVVEKAKRLSEYDFYGVYEDPTKKTGLKDVSK